MIDLYTGTPGSGKSLHIAEKIQGWIRHGYPVIGNFGFKSFPRGKFGGYMLIENDRLTPERLLTISEKYKKEKGWDKMKENQILLVIDECQLLFNARDWGQKNRKEWVWFFSQHRKLGYDIVMACQFDLMLDKQVRALVEYEYIHRKVSNIGIGGKLISLLFGGNLHVVVKVYKPLNMKVGTDFVKAKWDLYECYDTYKMFEKST